MKKFIICLLLTLLTFNLFSQNNSEITILNLEEQETEFRWYGRGEPFELSYAVDIPIIATCAGLYFPTLIYENFFNSTDIHYNGNPLNSAELNSLDKSLLFSFNKPLDLTADILSIGIALIPGIFFTVPKEDWITIGVMYGETYVLTRGIKELCKLSFNRARPYMYFDNPPQKDIESGDWYLSFPSGHTAYAFATAAFSTYMVNTYYPDASWKWALIGGSYALATIDGALRIYGGCHFTTDVITGALIGTATGFLVPWLHTLSARANLPVTVTPLGFNVSLKF